jgi:ATP-dependent Clp protease ATP-binding subunit ClpX
VRILTEPKNALVRQYQRFFEIEGAELEFTPGSLRAIAEKAMKLDTGARALRSVVESLMLDIMYDLPDVKVAGGKYVITQEMVESGRRVAPHEALAQKKESA